MSAGRVVVLGGATARTAEAVLRAFLGAGYRVVATARRPEAVRQTLARLPGGGAVEVVEADLLDPAGAARVVAVAQERFGRVDAMTTLASGGFQQRPFAETEPGRPAPAGRGQPVHDLQPVPGGAPGDAGQGRGAHRDRRRGERPRPRLRAGPVRGQQGGGGDADQRDRPRPQGAGDRRQLPGGGDDRHRRGAQTTWTRRACGRRRRWTSSPALLFLCSPQSSGINGRRWS